MSALEPLRAFIYSIRLDDRLSAWPFIVWAHTLCLGLRVGSSPCWGLVPLSRLDRYRYTQVQSMEENEIGLLLKPCNAHVGLPVLCDVLFTSLHVSCFPFIMYCCIGNHTSFADPFGLLVIQSGASIP